MYTVNLSELEDVRTIQQHIDYAYESIEETKADEKKSEVEKADMIETISDWIPSLQQYVENKDYICGFYDEAGYVVCKPNDNITEDDDGEFIIVECQM